MSSGSPAPRAVSDRPRLRIPIVIFAACLTLTGTATALLYKSTHARDAARFDNLVSSTRDRISNRLEAYVAMLRGTAAMFASGTVDAAHFARYASLLDPHGRYPGIQGVGYAAAVAPEAIAAFEAERRSEGSRDFHVWPRSVAPVATPVTYLEPLDRRNAAAMGYDMMTEKTRREAIERARDSGLVSVSGKVTLVQEIDPLKQAGFLMFVPIYAGDGIPDSVQARRRQLRGVVYAPFRADDLFDGIFGSERPRIRFEVFDGADVAPANVIHVEGPPVERSPLVTQQQFSIGGRTWTIVFAATPSFFRDSRRSLVPAVAVAGAAASLLLFALAWFQATARARAELASRRTAHLQEVTAALANARSADEVLDVMATSMRPIGAAAGFIALVDEPRAALWLARTVADGETPPPRDCTIPLAAELPIAEATRTGAAVFVTSVEERARRYPRWTQGRWTTPYAAWAALPLAVRGRRLGAMLLSFAEARAFSEPDRAFMTALATQSAQAYLRARLHDDEQNARGALDAMFAASPASIALVDTEGRVQLWNDAAQATFGWTRQEVLGQFNPAVLPGRREQYLEQLAAIAAGRHLAGVTQQARKKDGSELEVQLFGAPVPLADGRTAVLAIVLDVTAQTREAARQRLLADAGALLAQSLEPRATLERIAALVASSFADWCMVDLVDDGGLERVAVAAGDPTKADVVAKMPRRIPAAPNVDTGVQRAVHHGRAELVSNVTDDVIAAIATSEAHREALRAMRVRSYVCAPLAVSGRSIGALTFCSSRRPFDAADLALAVEIARRVAFALENTRLQTSLRGALQKLGSLQAVTSELSKARTPVEVAAASVRLGAEAVAARGGALWLRTGEALGLVATHGVAESAVAGYRRVPLDRPELPLVRAVAGGEPLWIENGAAYARLYAEIGAAPAAPRDNAMAILPLAVDGTGAGAILFYYDGSHRFSQEEKDAMSTVTRQCEQALARAQLYQAEGEARAQAEAARADAQAASDAKDQFLAMLGHELRNPLSPILTAVELMKLRGGAQFERERAVIARQAHHLVRLVDDLLDVSRITRGKIELRRSTVELATVLAQAIETASPLIAERQHRLTTDVPATGLLVEGDPVRLAQVFGNLLTNAAKYTPAHGHIEVRAQRVDGQVQLSVRDDGIGIAPSLLPRVFDIFVQGERALDRSEGGLGIGLALVRSLVQLHGGSVTARSDGAGRGAEFAVTLPLARAAALTILDGGLAGARPAGAARVLVVDDNVDGAEMLAAMLATLGYTVDVAHDGIAALARAAKDRPDVALVDIGLPGMDGYELAARLRPLGPIGLVAVTGYGQEADVAAARAAGFDHHVVKPVDPQALVRLVEELIAARRSDSRSA